MGVGSRSGGGSGGGGGGGAVDVTSIGGVPVTAAAKTDGMVNATAVLEVGAREQLYNGASWDRARSGFVGVVATYVGYQNTIPVAIFHAAPAVRADGSGGPLETDANGALLVNVVAGGGSASASVGLVGAAVPLSADYAGFVDAAGTLRGARTYDTDSGAGVENTLGVVLRMSGAGGSVEVSAANPLPVGVVTNVTVLGTVTANQGNDNGNPALGWSVQLSDGAAFYDTVLRTQLPAALVGGRMDVNVGAWLGSTAPTVGVKTMANSIPVAIASDQSTIPAVNAPDNVNRSATMGVNLGTDPDVSWGAAPGNVYSVYMVNKNTTKRYLQLFNKASAPVGGDVPVAEFPIAPAGAANVSDSMTLIGTDFFGTEGTFLSNGIATGYSTTSGTYTAGAAADQVTGIKLT